MKLPKSLDILAEYLDDRGWEYEVQEYSPNEYQIYFVLGNDDIEVDVDKRGEVFWYSGLRDAFTSFDSMDDLIDEKLETW